MTSQVLAVELLLESREIKSCCLEDRNVSVKELVLSEAFVILRTLNTVHVKVRCLSPLKFSNVFLLAENNLSL